ncbi:MAG: flagellar motor switch protein FliG [Treponema sp.]|nr:flagellar motor switch protein FliG [Treponema sp.]
MDKNKLREMAYSGELDKATDYLKNGGLIKVPSEEQSEESIYRKVAKFLILIGEDEAAKVLPHLPENQIEKIIPEIATIRSVDKDEAEIILQQFSSLLDKSREMGGIDTAREMLEKAYGKEKAQRVLQKSVVNEGKQPFDYLIDADCERIYLLIKDENPGVQSMVLSHLPPKKAAEVINKMKEDEKKTIVLRMAKMEPVSPSVLFKVDEAMREKSLKQTSEKAEVIDGKNALAQILKRLSPGIEHNIINYLSDSDPELGENIRERLFTMEDLLDADDRFIQDKLRNLTEVDIAYLIADKNEDIRNKILDNVSQGRRAEVLDQEEILKPMKKSECEKITSSFFADLRRAYEEGRLIINNRDDELVM